MIDESSPTGDNGSYHSFDSCLHSPSCSSVLWLAHFPVSKCSHCVKMAVLSPRFLFFCFFFSFRKSLKMVVSVVSSVFGSLQQVIYADSSDSPVLRGLKWGWWEGKKRLHIYIWVTLQDCKVKFCVSVCQREIRHLGSRLQKMVSLNIIPFEIIVTDSILWDNIFICINHIFGEQFLKDRWDQTQSSSRSTSCPLSNMVMKGSWSGVALLPQELGTLQSLNWWGSLLYAGSKCEAICPTDESVVAVGSNWSQACQQIFIRLLKKLKNQVKMQTLT